MEISTVISIISVVVAIVAISIAFATLRMFTNIREDMGKFWTMEKAFNSYTDVLDSARREISRMNEYQAVQTKAVNEQATNIKHVKDALQFFGRTISKETSFKEFRKKFIYCDSIAKANEDDVEKLDH